MLTESEVIAAVVRFLKANAFEVLRFLNETEQGIDVEALGPDGKTHVSIEAKGETSSKPSTARFGKRFSPNQVLDHVAKAVYCAARDTSKGLKAGIALPDNETHRVCVERILPVLKKIGIEVFWVLPDKSVRTEGVWEFS